MSSNIIRIVICAEDSFSLICGFLRPFHPWIQSLNSIFVIVQSLSHVWFFMTPWTAAHQGPLFSTISQNLLKLISIESVMISNHVILCCPLLLLPSIFPSIRVFSNELALCIRWPNIGAPTSAPVLPTNIQSWFPFRLTGLISLLPKGLSLTDIFSLWGQCPAFHAVFDITAPHHKDLGETLF